jgi:hypothetical protein
MDWTFVISQLIVVIAAIVSAIIAGIITVKYQSSGSLGVSQSTKDKFIAVILAILGLLSSVVPLWFAIKIAYNIYYYVLKWPDMPTTRMDALLIAFWVLFFHLLLVLGARNSFHLVKAYRQAQRDKIERELEARQMAQLKPLIEASDRLQQSIDAARETKSPHTQSNKPVLGDLPK